MMELRPDTLQSISVTVLEPFEPHRTWSPAAGEVGQLVGPAHGGDSGMWAVAFEAPFTDVDGDTIQPDDEYNRWYVVRYYFHEVSLGNMREKKDTKNATK